MPQGPDMSSTLVHRPRAQRAELNALVLSISRHPHDFATPLSVGVPATGGLRAAAAPPHSKLSSCHIGRMSRRRAPACARTHGHGPLKAQNSWTARHLQTKFSNQPRKMVEMAGARQGTTRRRHNCLSSLGRASPACIPWHGFRYEFCLASRAHTHRDHPLKCHSARHKLQPSPYINPPLCEVFSSAWYLLPQLPPTQPTHHHSHYNNNGLLLLQLLQVRPPPSPPTLPWSGLTTTSVSFLALAAPPPPTARARRTNAAAPTAPTRSTPPACVLSILASSQSRLTNVGW